MDAKDIKIYVNKAVGETFNDIEDEIYSVKKWYKKVSTFKFYFSPEEKSDLNFGHNGVVCKHCAQQNALWLSENDNFSSFMGTYFCLIDHFL